MRKITFFLLFFISIYSFAQYTDTFIDGDFTQNPPWVGTTDKFVVNSAHQLQLNAPSVTSTAYLSTPSQAINNASWQFHLKTGLLLTSGNYVNYYLVSDNTDFSAPLNGYYVMIGNTNKEVALYRQNGATKTKLITGMPQRLPTSGSITEVIVKVTRDTVGNWSLYSKLPSETNFVLEGTTTDTIVYESSYSGIFCNYSSANSTKYYFDDFVVTGQPYVDRTPPSIISYHLSGTNTLVINFSKPIVLSGSTIIVPSALGSYRQVLSNNELSFIFDNPIPNFQTFTVILNNVMDLSGNLMSTSNLSFGLFPSGFGDVIFNEIMTKPTPKVGLPDVEYGELYNRRSFPIDLAGWTFYYNNKNYAITEGLLPPNGYLLLCAKGSKVSLSNYGTTATLSSFPTLAKSDQLLYLTNDKNALIAFVHYSDSWYGNDFKKNGGWSLECVDSENLSGESNNWIASSDNSGGTPGHKNSTVAICRDDIVPHIIGTSFILPDTLTLQFNKSMMLSDLQEIAHYKIDKGILVQATLADFPQSKWVKLILSATPQNGLYYDITASNLRDVNENLLSQTEIFGLPETCEPNDVVINEVLSHPKAGGVPFVELYNRSDKIIELSNLWLNRTLPSGGLDAGFPITSIGRQLFPGEFLVLTSSQKKVCDFYNCQEDGKFAEMSNFPSLPNASGNVLLVNRAGMMIDSMNYSEKKHDVTIKDAAGVSFERVNPDWSSTEISNWHSCASDAGYATPGYKNSQYRDLSDNPNTKKSFWLEKDSFTPDNDGQDDLLLIHYKVADNGYSATVAIYDAAGRKVKQLTNNALLGTEGVLTWNGITDNDKLANTGVYVIYIDAVLPMEGKREQAKMACVIAAK
jgi:hypothetical protein